MNPAVAALAPWVLAAVAWTLGAKRTPWTERGLRAVAVCALAAMAGMPVALGGRSVQRATTGRSVLLLDGSASMEALDRGRDARRAVEREGARASRWWLTADGRTPAVSTDGPWPVGDARSRLIPALVATLRETGVTGVTVVTDGELEDSPGDVDLLPRECPPVRVVRVGRRPTRDLGMGAITVDGLVFRGAPARVTARLRVRSPTPLRVQVTARDERAIPLGTVWVDAPAGDTERAVRFDVTFTDTGAHGVVLEAVEPAGDELPGNARTSAGVTVLRDRLRVLLLGGGPDYDLRALRGALRGRSNVDLVSFFILRGDGDVTMASSDELALIPFPTDELFRAHLGSFDAVVVHELDPAPYGLTEYLPALARYVRQGGSLVLVGARTLGARAWREPPLGELLPARPANGEPDPDGYNPMPTPAAGTHPITRDLGDAPWPLAGAARFSMVSPSAEVLWTHPTLRAGDGAPSPILATARAGEGRVLLLATGSLWRAGFPALGHGDDPGRVERFWDRALSWLAADDPTVPTDPGDPRADERAGIGRSDRILAALANRCGGSQGTVTAGGEAMEGTAGAVRRGGHGEATAPWSLLALGALCGEWALRRRRPLRAAA